MPGALRIVTPLAIHEEAVLMLPWTKGHGRFPNAVLAALEGNWILLPVGEITHQQHRGSIKVGNLEQFFFLWLLHDQLLVGP